MAAEDFSKYGIVLALLSAILYQLVFKNLIWVTMGVGRELQPISDFANYKCRKLQDSRLQACEDMWLSENTRQLFLACSKSASRKHWMPNVGRVNASGRGLDDAIIAMDIDKRKGDSFAYRVLSTPGFAGVNGMGQLHLVGLTGRESASKIELLLVNAQPAFDASTNKVLDSPDFVIESFKTDKKHKASSLQHQQTLRHPVITSPNNVAFSSAVSDKDGFYFTNDHGDASSGFRHSIAPYIGNGGVAYCSSSTSKPTCHIVDDGYHFPNGLISDKDDPSILFVPSAWSGGIYVFKANGANRLERLAFIDIPYPIDNLSQDKNGDIWAAALPKAFETLGAFDEPLTSLASSTIFRIKEKKNTESGALEYEMEKVLEDRDKEVLPGATTVVHDVTTGRLFLSGVTSPFITVCDRV
ncbi:Putative six-bladed beta-propeller, TolB [Septoria linicola]|uniref:Six-bladed beta-propeller, TolB n=1 Tax=Septoria linicola TaxID=215465 RepID=A0A9Q9AKB6_9PEZI|nr:putative six-bladed beta-propeller, TolB [Septoria linicola]USW47511.1 Putative six-bladed beta-propeller, TolB [Septoria linicola]